MNSEETWRKEQTKQYNIRIMKNTGIPDALERASVQHNETVTQYIKQAILMRLKKEGFVSGDVILNLNKHRHLERLEKMKKYIEQEERKLK